MEVLQDVGYKPFVSCELPRFCVAVLGWGLWENCVLASLTCFDVVFLICLMLRSRLVSDFFQKELFHM